MGYRRSAEGIVAAKLVHLPPDLARDLASPKSNTSLEILELGGRILDEVYGGEPGGWRRPQGPPLRALSRECGVSVSTLYRYVAVADLWRRCGCPPLSHVGISHIRQLLPLEEDTQRILLEWAEKERWTVAETRMVAHLHQRRPEAKGRGRPTQIPLPELVLSRVTEWRKRRDKQLAEDDPNLERTQHLLDKFLVRTIESSSSEEVSVPA